MCPFISSPKSTPNNARWEREREREMGRGWCWFLRCTSTLRWVRSGRKVKGLRGGVGLLWLWFNFLSKKRIHEPRLDCGNGSQRCFHISLQFVVDRLILFQQNCPVLCINILSEHNSRDCSRVRIKEHWISFLKLYPISYILSFSHLNPFLIGMYNSHLIDSWSTIDSCHPRVLI